MREVARELAGRVVVVQVNTDENPRLAQNYGIKGIPALFLIKQGKVLDRTEGGMGKEVMLGWLGKYL